MIKMRKKVIGALAAVMAVSLAAGAALGLPAREKASAERTSAWVTVDEIYNDDASRFKASKLRELYQALAGSDVKTLTALENAMDAKGGTLTSADFRTAGGGSNNVSVTFGGKKWDAVYLTKATNGTEGVTQAGDIILDLWRSADELTSGDIAVYSDWATNAIYTYSSNMYSTSRIRVETLNAGGKYSTSGSDLTEYAQTESNQYARFTMSEADNSLTKYLAKPSEVGYQAKEWDEATAASVDAGKYYFPNDAYEEPQGGRWYNDNYNYLADDRDTVRAEGAKYGSWKDDYLWLPSLTEVGTEDGNGNGIWDTDASLRSAIIESGHNYYWLRSGEITRPDRAYIVYDSDTSSYSQVRLTAEVRPALHLNLTAAARAAGVSQEDWKGDTKPYDPEGVIWVLENTENVTITPVEQDGGTSWWNGEDKTISATKAGKYQILVKPKADYKWEEDDTDDTITVTYTVTPVDMTLTFNGTHLAKRRDVVFESSMQPIELKLPEPTDSKFPISWGEGVTWNEETKDKIKIQYIIKTHDEKSHSDSVINGYLAELQSGQHEEEWKDYDNLDEKTALQPMGYVVYFKATDTEGNHNPLINYFGIHIAAEQLNITLTKEAREAFTKGVEYGDVAHTKALFESQIVEGIEKITAPAADPSLPEIDRTKDFKTNIDNFTFYLRKDNTVFGDVVQDDGDVYTIEDDGVHLHKNGSELVNYLPLGTYHLYVAYTEPPEDAEDASDYITFAWPNGRPSFEVMARKITVTLTFTDKIYGQDPAGWVTPSAARTGGVDGTWYAPIDADSADDFHILNLSYTLSGTDAAPSKTTPAGTYTVTPKWTNANYEVTFAYTDGQNYTVSQREITETITWTNAQNRIYNGSVVRPSASVTVDGNIVRLVVTIAGENKNTEFRNVDKYTFTADLREADKKNYTFAEDAVLTKTAEITPATLNLEWAEKTFTYTGAEIGPDEYPTVTVSGRVDGEGSDEVDITIAPDKTFQNAGTYTFTATLKGTEAGNYVIDNDDKTHGYTINKATITVSGTYTDNKEYDGKAYSETVTATGKDLTVEMPVSDPKFGIAIETDGKDAKTYAKDITKEDVTYDDVNFTLVIREGAGYSITIKQKVLNADDINWGELTFEYSGSEQKPEPKIATGVDEEGDISLTVTVEGGSTDADSYTATAALPDTATNYTLSGDSTKEFTITPQKVTVNWDDLELPYNGAAQQPTATATDKQERSVTLTVTVTESEHTAVGQYHATAATDDSNYELESATTTFDIVACEIELTEAEKSEIEGYITKVKEYNGNTAATADVTKDYLDRFSGVQVKFTLSAEYNSKNVGTANTITVKVTLSDATTFKFKKSAQDVDYTVEGDAAISWTIGEGVSITAKSLTVQFAGLTQTYAAHDLAPTATAETGVGSETVTLTVTLKDGTDGTGSLTDGKAINAGVYSATAAITGTSEDTEAGNYSLTGETQNFTIERASATVTWTDTEDHVYSGSAFGMPKASAAGVGDDTLTLTVNFDESSSFTDAFKNAGNYVFKATIDGALANNYTLTNDKTETITITKKPVEAPEIGSKVYNGEKQTADVDVAGKDYKVKTNEGGTKVGAYDVVLELNDTDNFMWQDTEDSDDKTLEFKITQATNGWDEDLTLADWTYDGTAHEPNAKAKFGEVAFTYTTTDDQNGSYGPEQPKNAGTYWVRATVTETDDYQGLTAEIKFTISPKSVTVVWEGFEESYTYTGSILGTVGEDITANFTGEGSDGKITLDITFTHPEWGEDNEFKVAGSYTFTADFKDDAGVTATNYTLSTGATKTVTVAKKGVAAPEIGSKVYNGEKQTADVDVAGKDYKVKTNEGGTEFGTYEVVLELNDTNNYMWQDTEDSDEKTLEFKITQATNGWDEDLTLAGWTYDGTAHEATAKAKFGDVVFTYTTEDDKDGTYGDVKPKDAGTYWVKATVAGNDSYTSLEAKKQFTISPMTVAVTWEEKTYTYEGEELQFPTATANGVESEGTLKLTISLSGDDGDFKNAGEYTFRAVLDESDAKNKNYRLDEDTQEKEYTVGKASMGASFNNDHMLKSNSYVYRSDMEAIKLKLPDPTDPQFPITWANGSWEEANVTIYYIITTHEEGIHSGDTDAAIAAYLEKLREGQDSGLWKEYSAEEATMNVRDPKGYCIYFKIVDGDGNHNDYYDYFSVHIAHEELSIKLTDEARQGFEAGVEYGDFAHTKDSFETNIVKGIDTIKSADDSSVDKETFVKNIDHFTFYLRKDNATTGDIYTVLKDGIHLYKDGSSLVTNLPVGTYWLYVTYNGDIGSGGTKHIEFTWERGRPSFTVSPRKITVELTFKNHVYGDSDFSDWVTRGEPTRTTAGAGGNWYAPGEAEIDLGWTYSLESVGTPTSTTNAGTYNVFANCKNGNYAVTFVNAAGGELTYTIEKATVEKPDEDGTVFTYTGVEQEYHIDENPLYEVSGNKQTDANTDGYNVTIHLIDQDNYKWTTDDSEDLIYKFIIKKATLTVTAKAHSITYGEAPSDGGVEYNGFVNGEGADVLGGTLEYAYDYEQYGDVGESYTITPRGYTSGNYDISYESGKLEVKAKSVTVTIAVPADHAYNNIGEFTVTVNGLVNGDVVTAALLYSGTPNDKSSFTTGAAKPTLAGSYRVKATGLDGDKAKNYVMTADGETSFTIEKATVAEPAKVSKTFTYTGAEQEYTVSASDRYTVSGNKQTDAGSYNVTITLADKNNYKWEGTDNSDDLSYGFTIGKAPLTVTANDYSITYGEAASDNGVTYSGFVNGEDAGVLGGMLEYSYNYVQYGDVGSYAITPSGYTSSNYDVRFVAGTLEVKAKSVTVTITVPENLTYNDIGEFTATVSGLVNGDVVTAVLMFNGTPNDGSSFSDSATKPTLAGSYSVKAAGLGGVKAKNYTVTEDGETSFTVGRVIVTKPTADTNTYTYNGKDQTYTVQGGDSMYFSVEGNVRKDANESGYKVTVSLTDKGNCMWADTEESTDDLMFDFVIKKATLTVTAKANSITYGEAPSDGGVEYNGFVNGEGTDVLGGTLEYVYDYEQYGDVGENYTITPHGYTSDNYDINYVAGTLTVAPKEIEAEWSEKSYTYTGSVFPDLPTATAAGIGNDGTFTLTVALNDATQTFMNAGEYVFKATLNGADAKAKNYTLKPDTATHSYTVAKQTVAAPTIESKVYNGAKQTADVATSRLYIVSENNGGIDVDGYDVKLTLQHPENYKWADSETADIVLTFTITKADYDMSAVRFNDLTVDYDAKEHSVTIEGTLPNGVTVTYEGNGRTDPGEYTVTAIFTGDGRNYNAIPSMTALLKILEISHDLSGIGFGDVTVKYDGETHSIYIEGALPHGVTVAYENNGQTDPNVYTVTAVFSDHVGEFERMTAKLTILRTHTQSDQGEGTGAEVIVDSEDGFDPALELVVEKAESIERSYWAWGKDEISEKYTVKMCKDGEEVPIDGKMTVRILIPEEFRDKDFELVAVARATSIEYTRDGDYVVFESDGLLTYVFTSSYTPYFPIVFTVSVILLADVLAMIVLAVVIKKKRNKKVR